MSEDPESIGQFYYSIEKDSSETNEFILFVPMIVIGICFGLGAVWYFRRGRNSYDDYNSTT